MDNLFVYGTLRKGHNNHHVLNMSKAVLIDLDAKTIENYRHVVDFLPKVFKQESTNPVKGELYMIPTLKYVDTLEGHPHLYRREKVNILDSRDKVHKAWLYFFNTGEKYYGIQ